MSNQPDLRKAAEMAFNALRLYVTMYPQMDKGYMVDARETLRQALAQPEFDTPESHIVKWSIPVDPNNFGEPLAQPEQKPVAYWNGKDGFIRADTAQYISNWSDYYPEPLYTAPPKRECVGLTDEEVSEVLGSDIHQEQSGELKFIRLIEAKLREKNGNN